jgi:hypothetical protein
MLVASPAFEGCVSNVASSEGYAGRRLRIVRSVVCCRPGSKIARKVLTRAPCGSRPMLLCCQPNPIVVIGRGFLDKEFPVIPPPLYVEAVFSGASLHCLP